MKKKIVEHRKREIRSHQTTSRAAILRAAIIFCAIADQGANQRTFLPGSIVFARRRLGRDHSPPFVGIGSAIHPAARSDVPGSSSWMYVHMSVAPMANAARAQAAYSMEFSPLCPDADASSSRAATRKTCRRSPLSNNRAVGRPTMATPTIRPSRFPAMHHMPPCMAGRRRWTARTHLCAALTVKGRS
jgi:hypothetical protein